MSLSYFFSVLLALFIAEMGDKTQLMLFALTSKYKIRDIVIGVLAAICILNGISVGLGGLLNEFLKSQLWIVKLVATIAFFYFSLTSLLSKEEKSEENGESRISFAAAAVFCIFFIAELGDKTQLSAITFGATHGLNFSLIFLWLAATIGFFAADILGLTLAFLVRGRTPDRFFKLLAFLVFAAFGFMNLQAVLKSMNLEEILVPVISATSIVFVTICAIILIRQYKSK